MIDLQIASLLKIPFLDEDMPSANQALPPKVGRTIFKSYLSGCTVIGNESELQN